MVRIFPESDLLSTFADVDADRANAAAYIEQQALHLGIPLDVELTDLSGCNMPFIQAKNTTWLFWAGV